MPGESKYEFSHPADTQANEVPIRPAASLIIVRDGVKGIEVLALKRSMEMRFLPGYIAFPGGSVSEDDEVVVSTLVEGDIVAQEHQDDPTFAVACLRECAEEIGWACALRDACGALHDWLLTPDEQKKLLESDARYGELLQQRKIDTGKLRFVGRWVTPRGMNARFDTRFFLYVASSPELQPRIHRSELAWAAWMDPSELLRLILSGTEQAVPPTRAVLKALSGMATAEDCCHSFSVPGPKLDV